MRPNKDAMNYNRFHIFSHLSLLVTLLACQVKTENSKQNQRPNVLFIMSDDHAYQAISAYNDQLIQTPNIDRIANEGILFTNACVTNSICAPSRATILTGKHAHIHGKINNINPFDTTQITFPQLFQNAGYNTAMFGKLHFGNNPKGVDDFMILPGQGEYINPDFITNNGDTTIQGYVTDIITDLSIDWLTSKRDTSKPFMMMYLHKAPHRNWWPRADKFNTFSKNRYPIPETLHDDYANRGRAAREAEMNLLYYMKYSSDNKIRPEIIASMDEVLPKVPGNSTWGYKSFARGTAEQREAYGTVLDSISEYFRQHWPTMSDKEKIEWKYQRYMQDYLACISSVDDNVGRVLDYLDKAGLAKNTIVVYTSDQGFYLGEHGWFDKRFIYDESFKTPLLIRWPNEIKAGIINDDLVQNLDFAPTLLEAAQIRIPNDMQGESLIPLLSGASEKWTRDAVYYHYYEYPSVHMVKRHYGIITKDFKLTHFYYDIDEWELYDRTKDPLELNNVYSDPNYYQTVNELKQDLLSLREKYGDSPSLDQEFIQKTESLIVEK